MIEAKFYDRETKSKGTIICEELEEHFGTILCSDVVFVDGAIDITEIDNGEVLYIKVPTKYLVSVKGASS